MEPQNSQLNRKREKAL